MTSNKKQKSQSALITQVDALASTKGEWPLMTSSLLNGKVLKRIIRKAPKGEDEIAPFDSEVYGTFQFVRSLIGVENSIWSIISFFSSLWTTTPCWRREGRLQSWPKQPISFYNWRPTRWKNVSDLILFNDEARSIEQWRWGALLATMRRGEVAEIECDANLVYPNHKRPPQLKAKEPVIVDVGTTYYWYNDTPWNSKSDSFLHDIRWNFTVGKWKEVLSIMDK